MASFSTAKDFTKDLEGGFWNDPSAGWTYAGITKKFFPNWPGFALLAQYQQQFFKGRAIPRYTHFNSPELEALVNDFYKNNFWNKLNGQYIANQTIANFMYDFFVHKQNAAIAVMNAAARSLKPGIVVNPTTVSIRVVELINEQPAEFYAALRTGRINYYNSGKFSAKLARAFVKRVNKFPEAIYE